MPFAIHVILEFSENTSTGCLGAFKEFVDAGDPKRHGLVVANFLELLSV